MAAASNELESRLGHFTLLSGVPAKPTEIWIGLYLFYALPNEDGQIESEVSRLSFGLDTGYLRVAHGPGDSFWAESSIIPGQFYNSSTISFPIPLSNWGTVTSFGLHSSSEGDGYWISGFLSSPLIVNSGDPAPVFEPGSLVISFL